MTLAEQKTLLLSRSDVAGLLILPECIAAVRHGFELAGTGQIPAPAILGVHAQTGGLHVKAGLLGVDRPLFVAKANTNFPGNPGRHSLPTIQGVIYVADAVNGRPLAVMDSIEITIQRTGAATAVAARYLARPDSETAAVIGCGNQGRIQIESLLQVLPLKRIAAFDRDPAAARGLVEMLRLDHAVQAETAASPADAVRACDVCVTCTTSTSPLISADDVRPGTFIAAVGADNEHKQELDPRLFVNAKVVVDSLDQCAAIGDLHHAISAGLVARESVHGELASLVAGKLPGRTTDSEITIFDSTGVAHEDAVTAALVLRKAWELGVGQPFEFAS